jgi:hypothetical protein
VKENFYEELECGFHKFLHYDMKILLDFSAKVWREDIFKPTIENESLHKISNDNKVRLVNFAHLKISQSKVQCCNIHKYTWTSPDGKNTVRLTIFLQLGEGIPMFLMSDNSGQQIVILTTIWWWKNLGRDWQ